MKSKEPPSRGFWGARTDLAWKGFTKRGMQDSCV